MEELQIHSRSYIVRWIHVNANESISWSLQPHKKSLSFGIFKHPGGKGSVASNLPTSATLDGTPGLGDNESIRPSRRNSLLRDRESAASAVVEKLSGIGLKCVEWHGKCEADQVSQGRYDVHEHDDGMYGLVIDNTFSKTVAKTATFVLMTHPTRAPPKSGATLRYNLANASGSTTTIGASPLARPMNGSTDSLPHDSHNVHAIQAQKMSRQPSSNSLANAFYTGIMHKKRRKKNQGYAKRFFSLDFTSSTLSYYRSSHASALRGSIPLSLAAIGVDEERKEFSIDSGAEVWHLRLRNKRDFDQWKAALERATKIPLSDGTDPKAIQTEPVSAVSQVPDPLVDIEWYRVEELISRVAGSRDAMRSLAQDTDPKSSSQSNGSGSASPTEPTSYFPPVAEKDAGKLPFWKRKASSTDRPASASIMRRSFSAAASPGTAGSNNVTLSPPIGNSLTVPKTHDAHQSAARSQDIHDRCLALLRDLDSTVTAFSALLAESKTRRKTTLKHHSTSVLSLRSTASDDFYDAQDGTNDASHILNIRQSDELTERDDFYSDAESITSSDHGEQTKSSLRQVSNADIAEDDSPFPARPRNLPTSPVEFVAGRSTLAPPRQPPPSIIGFLRKNAGKDLSTVAMPVTANEPTSLLQRLAEPLEAAHLLSMAASQTGANNVMERLISVSAFAIATIASNRVKERAVRKPFNPMLGETYELIRYEDFDKSKPAYRFVSEKVTHHPVRMAWQADSMNGSWSITQTPRPVQKFWGKSVELNTEGPFRLVLHDVGSAAQTNGVQDDASAPPAEPEDYSWAAPTAYLRNVIAGEKYVEPVNSLTVHNETTGHRAVATFKAGSMFSGRSEDVTVAFFTPGSTSPSHITVSGKWTTSLTRSDTNATVWEAGPLVPDASKNWGFSAFAAKLNELTSVEEEGRAAPTDSRLRPDQRALEDGQLDRAEATKARLEERQRARRKLLETHGQPYKPRFFDKVDGGEGEEEVWRLRHGRDGYWECRERGEWSNVQDVFEL